jgi:ribosomal protein S28E/S33
MDEKKCKQFYLAYLKRTDYCQDMEGGNIQGNFKVMSSDDGERKILRKIFGSVQENYAWGISTNQEVIDWQREPDIVSEIRKTIRRRLWHVI